MSKFYDYVNFSNTRIKSDMIEEIDFTGSAFEVRLKKLGMPEITPQTVRGKASQIFSGTFTSVIPIQIKGGQRLVLKVNRLLKYLTAHDRAKLAKTKNQPYALYKDKISVPNIREERNYLTRRSDDPREDIKIAVTNIEKFSIYKKGIYDRLFKYIGEYMPRLLGFEVVDSPRRELERLRHKTNLSPEDYENIPEHEISLMEIWEEVDASSFSSLAFQKLSENFENPEYIHLMPMFATKLLEVFKNEGLMVDICDGDGIRAKRSTNNKVNIFSVNEVLDLLTIDHSTIIAYPRNVSFRGGRINFYDIYPADKVIDFIDNSSLLEALVTDFKVSNYNDIKRLVFDNSLHDHCSECVVIRYLALLKYLGADYTKVY